MSHREDSGTPASAPAFAASHGEALFNVPDSGPDRAQRRVAVLRDLDVLREGGEYPGLDRLIALASDVCDANLAAFIVQDETTSYQLSTSYGHAEAMPAAECLCTSVIATGRTVLVDDARKDARFAHARYVTASPFIRSFIGVPVGADPSLPLGVLAIAHTEPGRFGPRQAQLLERIADLVTSFLVARIEGIAASRAALKTEAERQRQHLYELIFNAIREGVNVHDRDGQVVEMNPACLSILGLSREEMERRAFTDPRWRTFQLDGSPFHADAYPVAITLRTGESFQNVPMGIELPTGERRWISINAVPLANPDTGEIEHAVVTMNDITAQHEAELTIAAHSAAMADALAEAERASKAKTDFLGVMSHELRTPMNAMLSCASLLSQSKLDPVQRRTLGVLEDAGKQMLVLLNDLLDLSSLNADKVRIDPEPVSLIRLIEDAAVIWASEVRDKGLSLSVMVDPDLAAPRMVDTARLLQVIGNLMANAIKFTTVGTVSLQAWPDRGPDGVERVAIEVEDTGPGVPREAAERIFSPFEQIDVSSKRKHGGLGLGLYIARRLAVAMGGDIELETRPGLGSCFTVRIGAPLASSVSQPDDAAEADQAVPEKRLEILCVDDNARNLYVVSALLRAAGHRTIECASGAEALDVLRRRKVDIVLLDMVMPEMDGFDVIARLREGQGPNAQTPVIACTANVLPDQIEAYQRAGTAGVVAKPIDPRAMLEAVAAAA
jgi:PAS domain S-box-containing protein